LADAQNAGGKIGTTRADLQLKRAGSNDGPVGAGITKPISIRGGGLFIGALPFMLDASLDLFQPPAQNAGGSPLACGRRPRRVCSRLFQARHGAPSSRNSVIASFRIRT
jgi:hypothetical protein